MNKTFTGTVTHADESLSAEEAKLLLEAGAVVAAHRDKRSRLDPGDIVSVYFWIGGDKLFSADYSQEETGK